MIEYLKQFGGRYPNYETEDGDFIYKPISPVKRNQKKETSPEIFDEEEEKEKPEPIIENISETKRKEREDTRKYLDEMERKLKQI